MTWGSGLLNEFLNFLAVEKNVARNTLQAYHNDLCRYLTYLEQHHGLTSATDIKPSHIMALLSTLRDLGLSVRSHSRNLSAIRMFHQFLLHEGHTECNPSADIAFPKLEKTLPAVLNHDEVVRVLSQPDTSIPRGVRDRAMLEFIYASGVRISELLAIRCNDLFFNYGFIRVVGKGNKERIVPIGGEAIYHTEHYLNQVRANLARNRKADNRVFLNLRGGPLSRMGFWKILRTYVNQAGVQKKSHRTLSGIRSPHICWRVALTCVLSRKCLVMRI